MQVRASHVFIAIPEGADAATVAEKQAQAQKILERAQAGEDFAKLARETSDDAATRADGGDLGYFGKDMLPKAIEELVFAMKVGDVRGPIRADRGFHVIKLVDRKIKDPKPFDEVEGRHPHAAPPEGHGAADEDLPRPSCARRRWSTSGTDPTRQLRRGLLSSRHHAGELGGLVAGRRRRRHSLGPRVAALPRRPPSPIPAVRFTRTSRPARASTPSRTPSTKSFATTSQRRIRATWVTWISAETTCRVHGLEAAGSPTSGGADAGSFLSACQAAYESCKQKNATYLPPACKVPPSGCTATVELLSACLNEIGNSDPITACVTEPTCTAAAATGSKGLDAGVSPCDIIANSGPSLPACDRLQQQCPSSPIFSPKY